MKHFLLTGMLSATVLAAGAINPAAEAKLVKAADNVSVKKEVVKQRTSTSVRLAPGVTVSKSQGIKKLHFAAPAVSAKVKTPVAKVASRAQLPDGYVLFESFEDWDGQDANWVPTGWTVQTNGDAETWTPVGANPYLPAPSDGKAYFGVNFDTKQQDEWLISPYVEIGEGMDLSYWLYLDPIFLFNLDNVDWDNMAFIDGPTVSATLQIYAQEKGGEWTLLRDYFDEYKDYSLLELYDMSPDALEKHNVGLNDFYGKETRVAFRYVGTDGNTMMIDAIGIGYPALEGISYMDPFETLYWGFDRSANLSALGAAIAQYPVYAPLTWQNLDVMDNVEFTWTYNDPITAEFVTANDPYELEVTYVPDYSSEAALRNNWFYPPTLTATSSTSTPAEYSAPYYCFQAGGKAEYKFSNGTELEACLLPFSFIDRGLRVMTVTDEKTGAMGIPVFGYDRNVDAYWLNYTLGDEEPTSGDYSHLEGIANLFMPSSEAALVVNGITVYGIGLIGKDAEFTATIYGVNEEMSTDISTMEVIATATIKGSDVITNNPADKDYVCLPFNFSEPVAIKSTEEHPCYFIMLQGFRSEHVEYFAPIQARDDDPNYICWGYILNHIDVSAHTGREAYYNLKPMVCKVDDEYYDFASSFAIGLNAEYPWLSTECTELQVTYDNTPVEAELLSYYDSSKLTVKAPMGIQATLTDSGAKKVTLTVAHNDTEVIAEGDLVVSGPGVEVTIPVSQSTSGISAVAAEGKDVIGVYDLTGRRIQAANAAKGIYVVKYSDGTSAKVSVK